MSLVFAVDLANKSSWFLFIEESWAVMTRSVALPTTLPSWELRCGTRRTAMHRPFRPLFQAVANANSRCLRPFDVDRCQMIRNGDAISTWVQIEKLCHVTDCRFFLCRTPKSFQVGDLFYVFDLNNFRSGPAALCDSKPKQDVNSVSEPSILNCCEIGRSVLSQPLYRFKCPSWRGISQKNTDSLSPALWNDDFAFIVQLPAAPLRHC